MNIAALIVMVACAAQGPARAEGGGRITLFGARWCAPCMAEYRDLPELAKAAGAERIVLAWVDRSIPVPAALAGQVEVMPVPEARRLARELAGEGYGLPMALLTTFTGRACPLWKRPLRPRDIPALRQSCAVPPR